MEADCLRTPHSLTINFGFSCYPKNSVKGAVYEKAVSGRSRLRSFVLGFI